MVSSISVAMIVKNEADHLEECLAGLTDLAGEFCIVDTGSCDSTVEIARRYHAKVSVFLWCDDFSAARNESLRICTRDWVFVVDADERIAREDLPVLRALAEGPAGRCYRFVTRNYTNTTNTAEFTPCAPNDPHARGFAGWFPSSKVRFFPNRRGAQFEGTVHELVHTSLERAGIHAYPCGVPIHHYPLLKPPSRIREKQDLYLQLGHAKVAAEPGNTQAYAELGNQYVEVGDFGRAVAAYRECLRLDPQNAVVLKDLGAALHLANRSEEAIKVLQLALRMNPRMAEAWRNLGVIQSSLRDWEAARECFMKAVEADPAWLEGHRYLSVALEECGTLEQAAAASRRALEANPDSKPALQLYLHQMLRLERREEARNTLREILHQGAANPELHNAVGELYYYDNLNEEAKSHFRRAARDGLHAAYNNLGVVLFKEGSFAQARDAFDKCLAAEPGHHGAQENLRKTLKRLEKTAENV